MALTESQKILIGIPVLVIMGLSFLARKRPATRWLQAFNFQAHLTEGQRGRLRRTQNATAGAQLILLGIIIPIGYLGLEAMFLSSVETSELVVVGLLSVACVSAGIAALARNR